MINIEFYSLQEANIVLGTNRQSRLKFSEKIDKRRKYRVKMGRDHIVGIYLSITSRPTVTCLIGQSTDEAGKLISLSGTSTR